MVKTIKIVTTLISIVLVFVFGAVCFYSNTLPDKFYLTNSENFELQTVLKVKSNNKQSKIKLASTAQKQKMTTTLTLFNIIPVKSVNIQKTQGIYLVPSGNVFGVKMFTQGVVIVGLNDIQTKNSVVNPAKDAGLKAGDVIISINGVEMKGNDDVLNTLKKSNGEILHIDFKRKEQNMSAEIKPVKSKLDGQYKMGAWVRDSSAGIGTITYYNPQTKSFGGLGHPICDIDTGEILPLLTGDVVDVYINGITKGQTGQAGELLGSFISNKDIGKIEINNNFGLFGQLNKVDLSKKAIPIELKQNVKVGKAKIISTINGNQPKEYDILIEKINISQNRQTKNIMLKVTDQELLAKTGGIVQGMSGSPIVQDGKLVGAVTHVFVNDSTRGYGIFVENMYNFSKEIDNRVQKEAS
jgi:stage IV sporulation protein B